MPSNKAKLMEERLQEEMHPFSARIFNPPPTQKDRPVSPEDAPKKVQSPKVGKIPTLEENSSENHPIGRPTQKQTYQQQVSQSTDQSTGQPTSQLTEQPSGKVVGRPKAFYITERLDQRLDKAVQRLQEIHGIAKVDRSTLLNAMLDREELFTDESVDQLVDQVVNQLVSRLKG